MPTIAPITAISTIRIHSLDFFFGGGATGVATPLTSAEPSIGAPQLRRTPVDRRAMTFLVGGYDRLQPAEQAVGLVGGSGREVQRALQPDRIVAELDAPQTVDRDHGSAAVLQRCEHAALVGDGGA